MEPSDDDSFVWTSASESVSSLNNMVEKHVTDNSAEESEYDNYKKKLQKQLFKNVEANGTTDAEIPKTDFDSDNEDYLNTRVKQEKKRSLSTSSAGTHNLSQGWDGGSKRKKRKLEQTSIQSDNEETPTKKHKKKKHVPEENGNETDFLSDYTNIEDKFTAEETVIQPRATGNISEYKQQRSSLVNSNKKIGGTDESSDNNKSSKKKSRASVSAEAGSTDLQHIPNSISGDNTPKKKSSKKSSKISELITFEEDHEPIESDYPSELSSRLNKYLRSNPNLQPVECVIQREATITEDDEVWLLKFPHNVDIANLQHSTLTLDTKCKTKVDGKTYNGVIEDGASRAPLMCHTSNNKPIISNTQLNGTVRFTERIPKIHIVEDNVMMNNQTNFIPLPDIKCRHPLFGSNYKKAIKVHSAIKSRLDGIHFEKYQDFLKIKKKKKSKKHKEEVVEVTEEEIPRVAKKRKHQQYEASPEPKKKRHKPSTDPIAWESEKAIEENLFDF